MLVTVNHKDNISVDTDKLLLHEVQSILDLRVGLYWLATNIRSLEIRHSNEADYDAIYGNIKGLRPGESQLLLCWFHWFANTIVNYARLNGYVEGVCRGDIKEHQGIKNDQIKKYCDKYVENFIPDIKKWRNKVSAHFTLTDPRSDDGLANIRYSVMPQIAWERPYFVASSMILKVGDDETDIAPWKLTDTFENLGSFWWPEFKLEPFKKIKAMNLTN